MVLLVDVSSSDEPDFAQRVREKQIFRRSKTGRLSSVHKFAFCRRRKSEDYVTSALRMPPLPSKGSGL